MGTNEETVYNHYQLGLTKGSDGAPECNLTATGKTRDGSFFTIHLTVVCPKPEKAQAYFPLSTVELEDVLQKVTDAIESLYEETR